MHPRFAKRIDAASRALVPGRDAARLRTPGRRQRHPLHHAGKHPCAANWATTNAQPWLLNGARERRFQPHRQFIARHMRQVRIADLDAGHAVNLEAAAAFNQALAEFIGAMPHIVDVLIEERAEKLRQRPIVWRLVRTFLYPLIAYPRAVALIDLVQPMSGQQIFDHLSEMLRLRVGDARLGMSARNRTRAGRTQPPRGHCRRRRPVRRHQAGATGRSLLRQSRRRAGGAELG